jgi:hypothetical protein
MFPHMRALLFATAVVLGLAGCHRKEARPAAAGLTARPPATAAECKTCNGEWAVHGLVQVESCLCRTKDVGKRCRDGLECEGECILQPGAEDVTEPGPPRKGFFVGRCSEFDHFFGCHKLLMDGTAAQGPTLLDETPSDVCID